MNEFTTKFNEAQSGHDKDTCTASNQLWLVILVDHSVNQSINQSSIVKVDKLQPLNLCTV